MYITVRTIYDRGDIDTAVKYYYDYEVAKTNLIMQRDILILELLLKYTNGDISIDDFTSNKLDQHGDFTFENDVLEFIDAYNSYIVRYEIKRPENHKNDYFYNKEIDRGVLGLL